MKLYGFFTGQVCVRRMDRCHVETNYSRFPVYVVVGVDTTTLEAGMCYRGSLVVGGDTTTLEDSMCYRGSLVVGGDTTTLEWYVLPW